jgi:hypothetical protein
MESEFVEIDGSLHEGGGQVRKIFNLKKKKLKEILF